ncbi:ATP-binding protein [Rheinheimera hassiensis]|uniref:ATP-binding protein n=1 Tax=Rheinheimera hassiensis TaxID=1193627 RepID=UPI001F06857F|nr:ATP-binding protein [Rheinheimera hassiensis]
MTKLRVRARAVDMLGRQQIAGIPTAIHELFKNAHDAYAERVEVDFFRRNRVLVLRDDGYGMTRDDVENRWLTLGTESRLNANKNPDRSNEWRGPKNLPPRSIMGEKGIGRLAIAVIAPVTLLMTRAARPDGLHNLVVALVHWGLFEQPGLDISEIDVPIAEFEHGTLPTKADIATLITQIQNNLANLEKQIEPSVYSELVATLNKVNQISPDVLDGYLNKEREHPLSLSREGYGTHFILLPVAPELDDDIDGGSDKDSSKLERNLLGFSNLMATDNPVIQTEFRDHTIEDIEERIGPKSFFSQQDFEKTDQYFEGEFNEYGQFTGIVSIYGKPRQFVCNWRDGNGGLSKCGPFSLRYGYVQGNPKESRLSPDDFTYIDSKTSKFGGLYIFRDDIRVLPYGNSDVDWLDIEKRRTKSAGDWFFSYRRGFGYVAITHKENGTLTEKAGREGFRENLAYRDFRAILVNFFMQLAYEFFRDSSPQGDDFNENKALLKVQAEILKKQQKKADSRRGEFDASLKTFFTRYNEDYFETETNNLTVSVAERLAKYEADSAPAEFASAVRLLEISAKSKIRELLAQATLALPRGLALTNRLKKDWIAFEAQSAQVRHELIEPARVAVEQLIQDALEGKVAFNERRLSALQEIEQEKDNTVRELASLRKTTTEALGTMQLAVREVLKEEFAELRVNIEQLVDDFTRRSAETPEQLDAVRSDVEQKIEQLKAKETELLDSLKRQMTELTEEIKARETLDDRFAAIEAQNLILSEQVEFYSEFAQMGMSVGILQHEFESAARGIRVAMADLKPWADKNPPLAPIYQRLRSHIEHLDGYLKVLDPLGRRLHRTAIELSGSEILNVVYGVFSEQLKSANIALEPTYAFRGFKVKCRSSALLGGFINVIDNAIYWLNSRAQGEKKIFLDADDNGFLISNNGPGIEERLKERIFDFGETTKPGGRGMGLAITRETLRREGFEIELVKAGLEQQPQFKIYAQGESDE